MRLDELKKFAAERKAKMHDPVENPLHYNRKGVECIQAIEASMSEEEF